MEKTDGGKKKSRFVDDGAVPVQIVALPYSERPGYVPPKDGPAGIRKPKAGDKNA